MPRPQLRALLLPLASLALSLAMAPLTLGQTLVPGSTQPAGPSAAEVPPTAEELARLERTWRERGSPPFSVAVGLIDGNGRYAANSPDICRTFEGMLKEGLQKARIRISDSRQLAALDLARLDRLKDQPDQLRQMARSVLGREAGMLLVVQMPRQGDISVSLFDLDEGAERFSTPLTPLPVDRPLSDVERRVAWKHADFIVRRLSETWTAADRELTILAAGAITRTVVDRVQEAARKGDDIRDVNLLEFSAAQGKGAAKFQVIFKGRQSDAVTQFIRTVRAASGLACRVSGERPGSVEVAMFKPLEPVWWRLTDPDAPDLAFQDEMARLLAGFNHTALGVIVTPGPPQEVDSETLRAAAGAASFDRGRLAATLGEWLQKAGFTDIRDLGVKPLEDHVAAALQADPGLIASPQFVSTLKGLAFLVHCQFCPASNGADFKYVFRIIRPDSGQVVTTFSWPDDRYWRYDVEEFDPADPSACARYVVGNMLPGIKSWLAAREGRKVVDVTIVNLDEQTRALVDKIRGAISAIPDVRNVAVASGTATSIAWNLVYEGQQDISSAIGDVLTGEEFKLIPVSISGSALVLSATEPKPPAPAAASAPVVPPPGPAPSLAVVPQPNRRALVIGINRYQSAPLTYAVADATLFHNSLIEVCGYPRENTILLTCEQSGDRAPTQRNIVAALDKLLDQAKPGDQVLIYFSGHGAPIHEDNSKNVLDAALCAQDISIRAGQPPTGLVPISALRESVRARVKGEAIFIIDACHSGVDRDIDLSGAATSRDFIQGATSDGMITLAACRANEVAREDPGLRHGFFTYYLNEGLTRADYDHNGAIELDELYKYTFRQVTAATSGAQNPFLKASVSGIPVLVQR